MFKSESARGPVQYATDPVVLELLKGVEKAAAHASPPWTLLPVPPPFLTDGSLPPAPPHTPPPPSEGVECGGSLPPPGQTDPTAACYFNTYGDRLQHLNDPEDPQLLAAVKALEAAYREDRQRNAVSRFF